MKIVIVSDNHTKLKICEDIANRYANQETLLLHCGDSEFAYDDDELAPFMKVAGNCDYDRDFPDVELIDTPLGKIFLTHGHHYRVGYSRNMIAREAKKYGARFAIYGHTHIPRCEEIDDIICINPGSIAQSRSVHFPNCYAVLEENNGYQVSYYDDQHKLLTTVEI